MAGGRIGVIGLLQRVSEASVSVDGDVIARIERGLLVLVGVEKTDDQQRAGRLLDRLIHYRVFPDKAGKLNLSLKDIAGDLLLAPQFTLTADTRRGRRPGLSGGATPEQGRALFDCLVRRARESHGKVANGRFGANMQVRLCNDGPLTFWLRV